MTWWGWLGDGLWGGWVRNKLAGLLRGLIEVRYNVENNFKKKKISRWNSTLRHDDRSVPRPHPPYGEWGERRFAVARRG